MKLSVKQQKFCQNYVSCGNATLAAEKAGYSKKTAKVIASNNMNKSYLLDYIKELQGKIESKKLMTATERQELLAGIARDAEEKTENRIRAIDTLNKMTGEYIAKIDVSGGLDNTVEIKIGTDDYD